MKLLFDQNLSFKLPKILSDLCPGSRHVRDFGLECADDERVWDFAAAEGYAIASKDDDFHQRSFVRGAPPKIVWIRRGNCSTAEIAACLRNHAEALVEFEKDPEAAFLAIS